MTAADLKKLLDRVQSWPEAAQEELVAVVSQIETELQGDNYIASPEELRIVDAAMNAVDAGEIATDDEIKSAFARFRSA